VKYEVGMTGTDGMTTDDALRNLTTELAAGKGPDILVMDKLSYVSYVEKGVLLDLSECYKEIGSGSVLFANIVDSYRAGDGLYTIPMSFGIPILTGEAKNVEGITTLAQLADRMEELRAERPEDYLFGFSDSENLLALLALSSKESWVTKDGALDMEMVTDFLTQAERIYDAQVQGTDSEDMERYGQAVVSTSNSNGAITLYSREEIQTNTAFIGYFKQAYGSGTFAGNTIDYAVLDTQIEDWEMVLMPGQDYGACETYGKLSVNAATKNPELAVDFIKTALSYDFQKQAGMGSMLMNKQAYYEGQEADEIYDGKMISGVFIYDSDGNSHMEEVYWPTEEQLGVLNGMAAAVHGGSRCPQIVYDAVMEKGQKMLLGEMSVEEAVDAIEKQVGLYLAE
ncbi:MAG: extracellular solute-binding protein, partial [Lachnospiraceae bacterium]